MWMGRLTRSVLFLKTYDLYWNGSMLPVPKVSVREGQVCSCWKSSSKILRMHPANYPAGVEIFLVYHAGCALISGSQSRNLVGVPVKSDSRMCEEKSRENYRRDERKRKTQARQCGASFLCGAVSMGATLCVILFNYCCCVRMCAAKLFRYLGI